jgi:hypothetical protein
MSGICLDLWIAACKRCQQAQAHRVLSADLLGHSHHEPNRIRIVGQLETSQ